MKKRVMFSIFSLSIMVFAIFAFVGTGSASVRYDFTTSVEGFTSRNNAIVEHTTDEGGRMNIRPTGSDPNVVKTVSMNADENNVLRFFIYTFCENTNFTFYFKRSGSSTVYGGSTNIVAGGTGGEYTIDLSTNTNWTGTIEDIRIDPADSCGTTTNPGYTSINYIIFEQKKGSVSGGVRNDLTDQAIAGVTVYFRQNSDTKYQVNTNSSGNYAISNVVPGSYELYCSVNGYDPFGKQITVKSNSNPDNNVALTPNTGTVSGGVHNNSTNEALSKVTVYLRQSGVTKYSAVSDSTGNFMFSSVAVGSYELFCSLSGFNNFGNNITVSAGSNPGNNVVLVSNVGSASGGVRDSGTNNSMNNVLVRLEQSQNIKYTAYSNSTGNYSFANVAPGTYDLVAIFGGYCNYLKRITITAGNNYSQNIAMDQAVASAPGTPSGETAPIVGTIYHYTTSGSTACIGHTIEYSFNWGDGTYSVWSVNKYADKTWATPNASGYSARAEARCQDNAGAVNQSSVLTVRPVGQNTLPNVNITYPQNGATVSSASITVSGTADDSDPNSNIKLVQFRVNGGNWQNASGTSNWSANITLIDGTNTIEAKAQDDLYDWSTVKTINVSKNVPEIVLQSIEFWGIDRYAIQTNPFNVSIEATANGGDTNAIDSISIILKGEYTGYNDSITLTETGNSTGEYTGSAVLSPIRPDNGMVTVSVVENNTWGNDETLLYPGAIDEWSWGDGDAFLTFGHALGKA
ncbi:MAG: carboxypeptidase regulatory-like domain-containing protein, partial [Deltaproteobacteria bacterium]|nr:carboxypeptidase regulatory-like domain-containing protein [Deltaproteobacteria bacterium]